MAKRRCHLLRITRGCRDSERMMKEACVTLIGKIGKFAEKEMGKQVNGRRGGKFRERKQGSVAAWEE